MAESVSAPPAPHYPEVRRRTPVPPSRRAGRRRAGWDLLLVCVAIYIASSVGRIHDLFPVLLPLKPALVSTLLAIGLWALQQTGQRRFGLLRSRAATCLVGLLVWGALAVPFALTG